MQFFYEFLFAYPMLSLLQGGFTLWMFVDASRRQVESFWLWVILLFQPLGAWAYFFTYKAREFSGLKGFPWWQRRESLAELRYQAEQRPTLASHLALAERLIEHHEHAQAVPYLEAAMAREPDHCLVLYHLASCFTELEQADKALPLLQKIVARDRCWSDYKAWRLLIRARDQVGDGPGSLEACRELAKLSPTLEHRCILADHLLAQGQHQEAQGLLERALQDHYFAPVPVRRRNRAWAREARRLQKRVPSA